jgi:UDP:flavonoid glycosyltransferase YjiC (YdhE family)
MSRILLTWELGLNLGHLTRLLPVAAELKARGHAVLVAARDLSSAAYVLAPAGISFVQAPHLTQGHPLPHRAAGYSDILRAQGWGDLTTLRGLVEGWINLYRMFRPDLVVADYSPTAVLAGHLRGLRTLLLGNGFEIPPATLPLPPFPGFSWATQAQAAASEALVVANAAATARAFEGPAIGALRDLFDPARALFATFTELDHYGERKNANYIGPLLGEMHLPQVQWPDKYPDRRVFVCVRPDTEHVDSIVSALKACKASVVCVAMGFRDKDINAHKAHNVRFCPHPVDLSALRRQADLCVSYGAEGTVASFLLGGVPQVISPQQVEAHMAARRIEALGAGAVLRGTQTADSVAEHLESALANTGFRSSAGHFASRHANHDSASSVQHAADVIESCDWHERRRPIQSIGGFQGAQS